MILYDADVYCVLFDVLGRIVAHNHLALSHFLENSAHELSSRLQAARELSVQHGWNETAERIAEVEHYLATSGRVPPGLRNVALQSKCSDLERHILRLLKENAFFHVDNRRLEDYFRWNDPNALWKKAFPRAGQELADASDCYLYNKTTACVFHCMRALEYGLKAFGVHLSAPITTRDQWEQIITHIESAIKKIDGPHAGADWKKRQESYSEAATNFRYLKNAWRNHVMHSRETYHSDKAHRIREHVETFMGDLNAMGLKEIT